MATSGAEHGPPRPARLHPRGATLLELLVALALVLAMAALVWPPLIERLDERRFETAMDVAGEHLLLARAHAQATGGSVEVTFVPERHALVARAFAPEAGAGEPGPIVAEGWSVRELPDGVRIVAPGAAAAEDEAADDAMPLRIAVYLPDGSTLLRRPAEIVDGDGRRARLEVAMWTGLPRVEILPPAATDDETPAEPAPGADREEPIP